MEHTNLDELSDLLNIELDKLSIWLASNKLTLNIDKSHFVIFLRARIKQNTMNISLCDISLNRVNFIKFLGVIIVIYRSLDIYHTSKIKFQREWASLYSS